MQERDCRQESLANLYRSSQPWEQSREKGGKGGGVTSGKNLRVCYYPAESLERLEVEIEGIGGYCN